MAGLAGGLGLPTRLPEVGIEQKYVAALAADAMKQPRLLANSSRDDAVALDRGAF
jgi:alcohol dehydrogenase class IV